MKYRYPRNKYPMSENGEIAAPCGCPACNERAQAGHFACEPAPEALLQMERENLVIRTYDDGAWRWFATALA